MNIELYQFAEAISQQYHASLISGWRTDKHNAAVGGVENSWHRLARGANAVDLKPDDPEDLEEMAEIARASGYQVKVYAKSIHIEVPW